MPSRGQGRITCDILDGLVQSSEVPEVQGMLGTSGFSSGLSIDDQATIQE